MTFHKADALTPARISSNIPQPWGDPRRKALVEIKRTNFALRPHAHKRATARRQRQLAKGILHTS